MNQSLSSDPTISEALHHLNSILVSGETIEAWAVQHRFFAIRNRRVLVAATSGRFISINRGILGGFKVSDLRWQDLGEVKIYVGIIGADITLKEFKSKDLAINNNSLNGLVLEGFIKEQAQQVYRYAQFQDQSWREKRRIRELEELRAKSGGISLNNPGHGGDSESNMQNATIKLQQAKQMLETKLISDSEFESIKARILNGF